jgi:RNA polymerase sigma-70 factor (ECF subfamily)
MNKWREAGRTHTHLRPPADQSGFADPSGPDPAAAFAEAEFQQHLVMRALQLMQSEFQPVTWKACWEHVVCDRPAAEVANELGITVNAVYLAKSRVLRKLRQELQGLLD